MNVLIDLTHPAHLHFFRNLIGILKDEGHRVKLTGRDKDILIELAGQYGIELDVFGKARKGPLNLGFEMLLRWWRIALIMREFRPDAMMAIAGTYISFPGKMMGVPTHVFTDTENATISNMISFPFATCVHVPRCYRAPLRCRHSIYNGFHELAYLHPNYFTPDPAILSEAGLAPGEKFTIVRFVGWGSGHDIGLKGFSEENKVLAVKELAKCGRVFISSEGRLPGELEEHRLKLGVARVHHLMAFAALIFGESATMASEGAILGIPGIFLDPVGRGYTDEEEHTYGLVFNFTPEQQAQAIMKGKEILTSSGRDEWKNKQKRLLSDKIDVTEMLYQIVKDIRPIQPGRFQ